MNDFIIMRRLVCFLLVWNLLLTCTLCVQFDKKQEKELNQQICMLEEIPMEELK